MPKALDANIVTLSFRGDLEVCRLLCASVDRYASDAFVHSLYVPAADMPLFANLAAERRRIATQESLLPRWFWKVPLPSPHWRARLFLPRRNVYLTPFSLPVRGWIAQQIMKIAAALASEREIVAFLDSDNALVRPLAIDHLTRSGKIRHYHDPHPAEIPGQGRWYEAARRLLGLPQDDCYRPAYIHPMIAWRRRVVQGMIQRIEATTGRGWVAALARTPRFAEHIWPLRGTNSRLGGGGALCGIATAGALVLEKSPRGRGGDVGLCRRARARACRLQHPVDVWYDH